MGPNGTYGKDLNSWSPERRKAMMEAYQASFDALNTQLNEAMAEGKDIFVKEHVPWLIEPVSEQKFLFGEHGASEEPWMIIAGHEVSSKRSGGNETVLPDEFLKIWRPTFLIRHPAMSFPSAYRTSVDNEGAEAARSQQTIHKLEMTLHWSRVLYDWFARNLDHSHLSSREGGVRWPIVLDADDIITNPNVVRRYAEILGFDTSRLKSEWNAATTEELAKMGRMEKRMRSTIDASTGIVKAKVAGDIDIDCEARKWKEEFGDETAVEMKKLVMDAMLDYEYLNARRLTASK